GADGCLSTRKCAMRWITCRMVKDGCLAYFHGGLPMAERRSSSQASEGIEREEHRRERGTRGREKESCDRGREEIDVVFAQPRERGERVLKEMADTALNKK